MSRECADASHRWAQVPARVAAARVVPHWSTNASSAPKNQFTAAVVMNLPLGAIRCTVSLACGAQRTLEAALVTRQEQARLGVYIGCI